MKPPFCLAGDFKSPLLGSSQKRTQNHTAEHDTQRTRHCEMPRSFQFDRREHSHSVLGPGKVKGALEEKTPADNRDDHRNPVPNIMERNDERSQREVHESIQEAADLPFLSKHDEELNPDTRLQEMGQTDNQEVYCYELFD